MPDMTQAYEALRKADAAGDTAGAKRIADYIRSQPNEGGTPTEGVEPVAVHPAEMVAESAAGAKNWFSSNTPEDVSMGEIGGAMAGGAAGGAAAGAALPGTLKAAGRVVPGVAGKLFTGLGEAAAVLPLKERMVRGAGGGAASGAVSEAGRAFGAPKAVTMTGELLAGGLGESAGSFLQKEIGQLSRFVANAAYGNVSGASRALGGMLSPNKEVNNSVARKLQTRLFGDKTDAYVEGLVGSEHRIAAQEAMRKADPSLNSGGPRAAEAPRAPWEDSTGEMEGRGFTMGGGAEAPGPKRRSAEAGGGGAGAAAGGPQKLEDDWLSRWRRRKQEEATGGGFAGRTEAIGTPQRLSGSPPAALEGKAGGAVGPAYRTYTPEQWKALPYKQRQELMVSGEAKPQADGSVVVPGLREVPSGRIGQGQSQQQAAAGGGGAAGRTEAEREAAGKAGAHDKAMAAAEARRKAEEVAAENALRPASQIYRDRMYDAVTTAVREGKTFSTTPEFAALQSKLETMEALGKISKGDRQGLLKVLMADRSTKPQVKSGFAEAVDNNIRNWGKPAEKGGQTGAAAVSSKDAEEVREALRNAYNKYTDRLGVGEIERKYRGAYSQEMIAQAKDELPHFLYGFGSSQEFQKMARNLARDPEGRGFIQQKLAQHLAQQEPKAIVGEFERLQKVLVDAKLVTPTELRQLRVNADTVKRASESGESSIVPLGKRMQQLLLMTMARNAAAAGGTAVGRAAEAGQQ